MEPKKLERWLRAQKARQAAPAKEMSFVEVAENPKAKRQETVGKYRLGFENGARLEVEGDFEREAVRALVAILREGMEC